MIPVLDLVNLKETSTSQWWALGSTTACFDSTYGPLKATYCYAQDDITTANCSPVFEDPVAGDWYVDEDEDETNAVGQEYCVGAFLAGVATSAASYGWVLTAGRNPLAMKTDGTAAAGYLLVPSQTDGTWNGVAASIAAAATAGTAYSSLYGVAKCTTADTSNSLAAGDAIFNSCWAGLPPVMDTA